MNISIITNFGCSRNCWYCVWQNHPLKLTNDLDLDIVRQFICYYKAKGKVSISGGGDPLYKFFEHIDFWKVVVDTCKEENVKLAIHTREKLHHTRFWKNVHRCSFSVDTLKDDEEFLLYLKQHTKVRIYKTVTSLDTQQTIEGFISFSKTHDIQLTFKQLYGYDDNGNYQTFKNKYDDQFFLDTGDYNIYLMPDNSITNHFN